MFVLSATFLDFMPWLQLMLLVETTLFIVAYKVHYLPQETRLDNFLDLYNEITLLIISILLFPLCDYVDDVDVRFNIGWAIVGITILFLLVNFICVVSQVIK